MTLCQQFWDSGYFMRLPWVLLAPSVTEDSCHFSAFPSYLTVGKWLEMDLESKQGLLKTQGTGVLGRQNVGCVVPGLGF